MLKHSLAIYLFVVLCLALPVRAQNFAIVATVNGEAISNFTVFDRISLMIASSGLEDTQQIRAQLSGQVLQTLINETLQKQEAERNGIKVTQQDMDNAVAEIEQRNNLEKGNFDRFIATQGINKQTLLDQLESQIIWKKIVARKIHPKIVVSKFEEEEALTQYAVGETVKEVELSEILLPITQNGEKEALMLAEQLVKEVKGKQSFASMAEQFSAGATASSGGEIGWVNQDQLRGSLRNYIEKAGDNEVLPPIRTDQGYRIIYISGRRTAEPDIDEEKVKYFLRLQKLDLESRRYMKQLRQDAFIEIRV